MQAPRGTAQELTRREGSAAQAYHVAADVASRFANEPDDPRREYWVKVCDVLRERV